MANSRKKVILRTFENTLHQGYLPPASFVDRSSGILTVNLLDLAGRMIAFPLAKLRFVSFVRDFNLEDRHDPERLSRRIFLSRPRAEGLWIRASLMGGEVFEGLAPLDATLLDALIEDGGLFLSPPDVRSNTQRLFLPRTSIVDFRILAVITMPSKAKLPRPSKLRVRGSKDTLELPFPHPSGAKTASAPPLQSPS